MTVIMYLHIYFCGFFNLFLRTPQVFKSKNAYQFLLCKTRSHKFSFSCSIISNLRFQNLLGATTSLPRQTARSPYTQSPHRDSIQRVTHAQIPLHRPMCSLHFFPLENQKQLGYCTCSLGLCPLFIIFKTSKQILYKKKQLNFEASYNYLDGVNIM